MSYVISRFMDLNWDQVFNKKKGMTGVKISLKNEIEFFSERNKSTDVSNQKC